MTGGLIYMAMKKIIRYGRNSRWQKADDGWQFDCPSFGCSNACCIPAVMNYHMTLDERKLRLASKHASFE